MELESFWKTFGKTASPVGARVVLKNVLQKGFTCWRPLWWPSAACPLGSRAGNGHGGAAGAERSHDFLAPPRPIRSSERDFKDSKVLQGWSYRRKHRLGGAPAGAGFGAGAKALPKRAIRSLEFMSPISGTLYAKGGQKHKRVRQSTSLWVDLNPNSRCYLSHLHDYKGVRGSIACSRCYDGIRATFAITRAWVGQ